MKFQALKGDNTVDSSQQFSQCCLYYDTISIKRKRAGKRRPSSVNLRGAFVLEDRSPTACSYLLIKEHEVNVMTFQLPKQCAPERRCGLPAAPGMTEGPCGTEARS